MQRTAAVAAEQCDPWDDPEGARWASEMLRAVAHPLRLRIIAALAERDQTVNELATLLDSTQSMISQQLRILRMSRLVDVTRAASFAHYRLVEPALRGLLNCIRRCSSHGAGRA